MGYDGQQCAKVLTDKGYTPTCDPQGSLPNHCEGFMTTPLYHDNCAKQDMYAPVQFICCQNTVTKEIQCYALDQVMNICNSKGAPWTLINCYCCCACFAWDTLVGTPDGGKQIYTIGKGDIVLVGNARVDGGNLSVEWKPGPVTFGDGTGPGGHQAVMVYLEYGTGEQVYELVCSPDQPFLLPSGLFVQALNLRPGDELLNQEGQAVQVQAFGLGEYTGGVHHITAGDGLSEDPYSHLLLTGGTIVDGQLVGAVIAGDYDVQMGFPELPASAVSAEHRARPTVGTREFEESMAQGMPANILFARAGRSEEEVGGDQGMIRQGKFRALRKSTSAPSGSQSLFTQAQAEDILANGQQVPISNTLAKQLFETTRMQLAGFYPDVTYLYDPFNVLPNLYAYDYYGQKTVLMSAGLTRLMGFNYEAIMMAMAWGASCFYGGEPKDGLGFTGIAGCDYYSFGIISRHAWIGSGWMAYVQAGMSQWFATFDLINPVNRTGNPLEPLTNPSIECRKSAINQAFVGGGLPECGGGPKRPRVELLTANADNLTEVQLNFSIELTNDALDPSHYDFTPPVVIDEVAFGAKTFNVLIKGALEADTQYEVKASGLTSYIGTGMDPEKSTAQFTSPAT